MENKIYMHYTVKQLIFKLTSSLLVREKMEIHLILVTITDVEWIVAYTFQQLNVNIIETFTFVKH